MSNESSPPPAGMEYDTPQPSSDPLSGVNGPPRAPLAFRVGVTGHRPGCTAKRPDPNVAELRKTACKILQHIADVFKGVADTHSHLFDCSADPKQAGRRGTLRVVSALAAGADQWVAEEAIALDYELQSPLPFSHDDYEEDFEGDMRSGSAYETLLNKASASAVLELDGKSESDEAGKRLRDPRSYKAVGRVLLDQSDILIAVWDGEPERGEGGTGQVVREALERGIPVITIYWTAPQTWRLLHPRWRLVKTPEDEKEDWARLTREVQNLLLPPETKSAGHSETTLEEYFCERLKGFRLLICCWPLFHSVVTWRRPSAPLFRIKEFEQIDQGRVGIAGDESVKPLQQWINKAYDLHYTWANALSIYYASLYRSSFVLNYFLGALAVFLALFGVIGGGELGEKIAIGVEFVSIGTVLFITWRGHKRRWHQRWIDYRMLAERLRLARILALFGGGGQPVSMAGHLAGYGNPASTWMNWHYRAIERAAGLPSVVFNEDHLAACQKSWLDLIEDQMRYHNSNSERFKLLDKRLHRLGSWLFVVTGIVCFIHFCEEKSVLLKLLADHLPYYKAISGVMTSLAAHLPNSGVMTSLAAILPAFGAACAGIRSQGEFHRVMQRSEAMRDSLAQLQLDFASVAPRSNDLASGRLYECAQRVTDLMAKEMLDWRVVFQDQPLTLPS